MKIKKHLFEGGSSSENYVPSPDIQERLSKLNETEKKEQESWLKKQALSKKGIWRPDKYESQEFIGQLDFLKNEMKSGRIDQKELFTNIVLNFVDYLLTFDHDSVAWARDFCKEHIAENLDTLEKLYQKGAFINAMVINGCPREQVNNFLLSRLGKGKGASNSTLDSAYNRYQLLLSDFFKKRNVSILGRDYITVYKAVEWFEFSKKEKQMLNQIKFPDAKRAYIFVLSDLFWMFSKEKFVREFGLGKNIAMDLTYYEVQQFPSDTVTQIYINLHCWLSEYGLKEIVDAFDEAARDCVLCTKESNKIAIYDLSGFLEDFLAKNNLANV